MENSPESLRTFRNASQEMRPGLEEIIYATASPSHEMWRQTRKQEDGSFNPRKKPLNEEAGDEMLNAGWLKKNEIALRERNLMMDEDGKVAIDIANMSFAELPPSRQRENYAGAKISAGMLLDAAALNQPLDEALVEKIAEVVHDAWVGRHRQKLTKQISEKEALKKTSNEETSKKLDEEIAFLQMQLGPYENLSEAQKQLDRDFPETALKAFLEKFPGKKV